MNRFNFGFVVLIACGLVCVKSYAHDEATDMPVRSPDADSVTLAPPASIALPEPSGDAEIATDTPVTHEAIEGDQSLTTSRAWRGPEYANQTTQLGWSETAFAVPKGLETQVNFWVDIYSKYTTDQGVLHDSEYIDLVYAVLDFTHISSRSDLNGFQKERMKINIVKDAKKRVIDMLKRFETLTDATTLPENEKKVWDYFVKIEGKKKFKEATANTRLRFQLGQRDRIVQGIFFSGRYLEEFERIFRDAGLQRDSSITRGNWRGSERVEGWRACGRRSVFRIPRSWLASGISR